MDGEFDLAGKFNLTGEFDRWEPGSRYETYADQKRRIVGNALSDKLVLPLRIASQLYIAEFGIYNSSALFHQGSSEPVKLELLVSRKRALEVGSFVSQ